MSFEIVYTSSQRGLYAGARGFCTVAATTGIPRQLQEKLESLSGYQHVHAPGSKRNAVNFCCQAVRIQDETWIVLSRVGDAGTDFSGRSNKIAHHLAMSSSDVRSANCPPTALLADENFWFTKWTREPEWLPVDRMPTPVPSSGIRCNTWKKTFGDAGWAGIVARSVENDFEPVFAIVPEGCNALGLVNEALQQLPPRMHWKVSFSTYFTRSSGADCHWRFLRDGMEEATVVRNRPVGIVIDSNSRIDPLDHDSYIQSARSGDSRAVRKPVPTAQSEKEGSFERRPVTQSQLRRREAGARARQARTGAKVRPERRIERDVLPEPQSAKPTGSRFRMWWISAGVLCVSVLTIFVVWLIVSN